MSKKDISTSYDPSIVEQKWYKAAQAHSFGVSETCACPPFQPATPCSPPCSPPYPEPATFSISATFSVPVFASVCVCACLCVYVSAGEKERGRKRERERQRV